jgi:hypothetical protein
VTLYAAPARAQAIAGYEEAGVGRYVFLLRSEGPDQTRRRLDRLDAVIAEYRAG